MVKLGSPQPNRGGDASDNISVEQMVGDPEGMFQSREIFEIRCDHAVFVTGERGHGL